MSMPLLDESKPLTGVSRASAGFQPVSPILDQSGDHPLSRFDLSISSLVPRDPDELKADHHHRRGRRIDPHLLFGPWTIDVVSWLLGAGSLSAALIILMIFNQQPLSAFHSSWTLNSMIGAIGQLSTMSGLVPVVSAISQLKWLAFRKHTADLWGVEDYDRASRGLLGSLGLIYRRPKM